MQTRTELREFFNIKECQEFINRFSKNKDIIRKDVVPIYIKKVAKVKYMVLLEYTV